MQPKIFIALAVFSGVLHIFFDSKKNISATYVFKPLVCTLLIVMLLVYGNEAPSSYRNWILAGLGFSLLGDIFLMLKNEKFIQGLAAFFIAHFCYIIAFLQFIDTDKKLPWISYFALIVVASFAWGFVKEGVGKMKLPVIFYIAVITTMVMLARTWLTQAASGGYLGLTYSAASLAYIGAILFMISDTNLAVNKFKHPYKAAQVVTLSTYYLAQVLIAWSVLVWN